MKFVCPLVVVEDIQKSRYLYETVLGQTVQNDFGENITFKAANSHGEAFSLHLKSHFQELIDGNPIKHGGNSFELYFEEDDLTAISEKLKAHKLDFLHEIREQPWRQQVMRVYDYDRNIIEIGESMEHTAFRLSNEGLSLDEISSLTYMPLDFVKKSIERYKEEHTP